MATTWADPRQPKPDLGAITTDFKAASLHDSRQPSAQDSRTASIRSSSVDSFKSTVSQVRDTPPTTAASTNPSQQHFTDVAAPATPITPSVPLIYSGPTRIPLTAPYPGSEAKVPSPLNDAQKAMYKQVLSAVSDWTTIPATTHKNAPQEPMTEAERMWLTRECLLRYLRATKWKVPDAIKRLQGTLSWRREYGADTFSADYISPENETGKQVVLGYDFETRPCLYLNVGRQNTKMSDRQIHHLSYMLDRVLDMLPPGQETTALLINFKGAASGTVPSVGQAKAVLNILQNHNPERLGRALISELPWYVLTFFKLISPFIDPVTREKMKFNEDLSKYTPKQQLWKGMYPSSGELDFEYEHNVYWPALTKECARRREAYRENWIAGGKRIGEYEEYLRGGEHMGLAALEKSL